MVFVMARAKRSSSEKPVANLRIRKNQRKFPFRRTDAGNAELFAKLYRNYLRYDHKRKFWLVWREHWWEADVDGEVQRKAKEAARTRLHYAGNLPDTEEYQNEMKWALKSELRYRLDAVIALAQSERPLADAGQGWDAEPDLLGVANGVVDLRTGCLRPGRPEDRITSHTHVPFDPAAQCPRWLKFLEEVLDDDPTLVSYVHRFAGYCLTGSTEEQCFFLLYGPGANGKTTFLETLRHVLGDYACNLPFSAFELKARSSIPNDVAAIAGKRFVTSSETDESAKLNAARIKTITGSDKQSGRFLYGQLFEFDGTAKLVLACNHKPSVADDTHGFWRKVRLILFPRKFDGKEKDQKLKEKLLAEAPGILAWAVRGCIEWQKHGLGPVPAVVAEATEEYRRESDIIGQFLDDCCVLHKNTWVAVSSLRDEFEQWSVGDPDGKLNNKVFAQRLRARGLEQTQRGSAQTRTRVWLGICRKQDATEQGIPAGEQENR